MTLELAYVKLDEFHHVREKDAVRTLMRKVATHWVDIQVGNDLYTVVRKLTGRQLEKGQIVLAGYTSTNAGVNMYEVEGFTDDGEPYGKGGVTYGSVAEVLDHQSVTTLKALEALEDKNEYGHSTYMVVRDLRDGESGPWFYLYQGRWSRGSGAEPLSFIEMRKYATVCPTCAHVKFLDDTSEMCEVGGTE